MSAILSGLLESDSRTVQDMSEIDTSIRYIAKILYGCKFVNAKELVNKKNALDVCVTM